MFKGYDESLIRPIATVPITDEKDIAKLPPRITGFETTPQKVCIAHRDEKDYSLIFDYTRPDISVDSGPEYLRDVAAATKSTLLTMQIFETMVQENSLSRCYFSSLLSYYVAYLEATYASSKEDGNAVDVAISNGVIFGTTQTLVECILDMIKISTRLTPISVWIQTAVYHRYPCDVKAITIVTRDEGEIVYRRLLDGGW